MGGMPLLIPQPKRKVGSLVPALFLTPFSLFGTCREKLSSSEEMGLAGEGSNQEKPDF